MEPIGGGKYKCAKCGYVYDPEKGDPRHGIEPGTKFEELPENIIPVMMFAMGYPSEKSQPNAWHFKRMPLDAFVTEL